MSKNLISVTNSFNSKQCILRAKALTCKDAEHNSSLMPACHFHIICIIWPGIYREKLLLAHRGGGGGNDAF